MTSSFLCYPLLSKEEVKEIVDLFATAEWENGISNTFGLSEAVKKNQNVRVGTSCYSVGSNIIYSALDKSEDFFNFVQAKNSSAILFSKTKTGGYYHPHVDNWENGDFSTTVFLQEPNSYDGGHLVLLDGGREFPIKLPSGWAVTYRTGVPHRVDEVTKGERDVAVFWSKTSIKDDAVRETIGLLVTALKKSSNEYPDKKYNDLIEATNDPPFLIASATEILRRKFSQ